MYLGDFAEDETIYLMFNTFTSDDPSASATITNFTNTDVHIYKNDGLTQRNNAAGITVSIDFDGITGSHMIKIDTSDDTVAGFWVTGSDYFVRIEGATVDAATLNVVVGHFSIENRFMRGTDSAATAAALSTHDGKLDTVDGVVDAILLDTAEIGTAGAGLTTVPWNAAWDAEVQSECADALTAYDPPTKAEMDTGFSGLNDLSAAEVNAQVDTALSDIHLDHLLAVDYDPASKPGAGTALLNELVENDSGVSRFTANALEQAPSGTGASAATIADAVWDEAKADHTAAGSFGETNQKVVPSETINDYKATGFSTHSAADVRTEMDSNSTQLADILTDTGTTLDGKINTIDTVVDAIKLKTDNLPTDPADESLLEAKIDALNDVSAAEVNAQCDTAISDASLATAASITALNDLAAADVWAAASALSGLDFSDLVERVYQFLVNRETITDATGAVALRNVGNSADLATWTINDDDTITVRTEASWT